jgi:endonuclease/exonuclease/phosphatase family metal-dependent hydrolase
MFDPPPVSRIYQARAWTISYNVVSSYRFGRNSTNRVRRTTVADARFLLWNVEWMNDLFVSVEEDDDPAEFRPDGDKPAHSQDATVRQRRDDLSGVLDELEADVVVAVEGPNRTGELQLFFDEDVEGEWQTWVQPSKGSTQCIGVAVRVDGGGFADPPFEPFDTQDMAVFDAFLNDADDDGIDENYAFERRPLYVQVNPAEGSSFRVLGLHLKSKGIFGAYEWSKWWQIADANRRKILAQATQVRLGFLDPYMTDAQTKDVPLIVCGDINDGPGLDANEKKFFGSGIERLMGTVWRPELCLRNAIFESLPEEKRAELDFEAISTTSFQDPIFNNTWHSEWIDHVLHTGSEPWVTNASVHEEMPDGAPIWRKYPHASDHYPISVTVST